MSTRMLVHSLAAPWSASTGLTTARWLSTTSLQSASRSFWSKSSGSASVRGHFTKLYANPGRTSTISLLGRQILIKNYSTAPPPSPPPPPSKDAAPVTAPPVKSAVSTSPLLLVVKKILYHTMLSIGFLVVSTLVFIVAFFVYDASTYNTGNHDRNAPSTVSQLALQPRRGGPKSLPILESYLDDHDTDLKYEARTKPRLVILGSGWGSVALMNTLDPSAYNVTVVSPTNYFLFTPMLPSATVGTLEIRSLIEPIRRLCHNINAHYLEASADKVEFSEKLLLCSSTDKESGEKFEFYVPYDKLVIGVGSTTNTHGVDGLEHCHFLKTVADSRRIRQTIMQNLERACLPNITDEERKRLLSFVVCGGGPTGVEFAAEVFDLMNEDLITQYPKIIGSQVTVHVIQSRSNILNTYDQTIAEHATEAFRKDSIEVLTNSRVVKVLEDRVLFTQTDPKTGDKILKEVPFGLCLWSTGVAQNPLAKQVVDDLGEWQQNKRAIETDSHLRVIGAPLGDVYAIGDCSTVRTRIADDISDILRRTVLGRRYLARNSSGALLNPTTTYAADHDISNVRITYPELADVVYSIKHKYPQASEHIGRLSNLFEKYDHDHKGTLSFADLTLLLQNIDKKITSLPATAQRANQQGQYLGRKLTKLANTLPTLQLNAIVDGDVDDAVYKPFSYRHLGSLAYIGNAAVFDFNGYNFFGGVIAMYLWRSVYFAQCVSFRTRALMIMDWFKRGLFGRDFLEV